MPLRWFKTIQQREQHPQILLATVMQHNSLEAKSCPHVHAQHVQQHYGLLCSHNADQPKSPVDAFLKLLRDLIPDNIAAAATEMNLLGIIFFSVCFGAALSLRSSTAGCRQIMTSVAAFNDVIITMVQVQLMPSSVAWPSLCPACSSVLLLSTCK